MIAISFRPATPTVRLCPLCFSVDDVRHTLDIYELRPLCLTKEMDLATHLGLCQRKSVFLFRTNTGNWMVADPRKDTEEFLGADNNDDEDGPEEDES